MTGEVCKGPAFAFTRGRPEPTMAGRLQWEGEDGYRHTAERGIE